MADPINNADLVQLQDQQRTQRAFIGFLSTAFGLDQASAGYDNGSYNQPAQYQTIGPTGVGVEGKPVSTAQQLTSGAASLLPLALLAVAGVLVLRELK